MKRLVDFTVIENIKESPSCQRLVLQASDEKMMLDDVLPGQFVQVEVAQSKATYLRRPISVNFVDVKAGQLHLLVRRVGDGTRALCELQKDDVVNIMLPLGNGYTLPKEDKADASRKLLLVGGGVGVAPLLYLGQKLKEMGYAPHFLLAAKTAEELAELEWFAEIGEVCVSTDDGTMGHHGLVSQNPIIQHAWDCIYCCGSLPMMRSVAAIAHERGIQCQVSHENTMACGLGACLCCVENTVNGHVCVCTHGPVFDINELRWFE